MKSFRFTTNSLFLIPAAITVSALTLTAACDHKPLDKETNSNAVSGPGAASPLVDYTVADVAAHNSASDCWIIMNGKVYNVTAFLSSHPGGTRAISRLCGQDATTAFDGVGHSSRAISLSDSYQIGKIVANPALRGAEPSNGNTDPLAEPTPEPIPEPTPVPTAAPTPVTLPSYTWEQIGQHAVQTDCWIVIEKNVYNVTAFLAEHPAGPRPIARFCGKDATAAFGNVGHSDTANRLRASYLIGTLAQ
jgi:cytochrome b involved in lipid metabolism